MKQYLSLFFYSVGVILFSHDAVAQHAVAAYRMPIEDCGILISPSQPGDPYYESDGGGMREPNIYKVGNTYYLFYDGAATHAGHRPEDADPENHLWRTHLAKSKDLKHWERLGYKLRCGIDDDPQGAEKGYKDFWSASRSARRRLAIPGMRYELSLRQCMARPKPRQTGRLAGPTLSTASTSLSPRMRRAIWSR